MKLQWGSIPRESQRLFNGNCVKLLLGVVKESLTPGQDLAIEDSPPKVNMQRYAPVSASLIYLMVGFESLKLQWFLKHVLRTNPNVISNSERDCLLPSELC